VEVVPTKFMESLLVFTPIENVNLERKRAPHADALPCGRGEWES